MTGEVTLLVADDDEGHALLVSRNLRRGGLDNEMLFFRDGQEVLDFLLGQGPCPHRQAGHPYLLLLDIRMPKVDGVDVLRAVKADPVLRRMPVFMVTTTDDPREISRCHDLGCNGYLTKPVLYERFVECVKQLGGFLGVLQVPPLDEGKSP